MDKLIIIRTDNQNNLYEQIISLITANQAKMETMSFGVFPTLFFPGLEIRQHQRRVFRDGEEINLTRLEYSTLVFLASNPGNVLTQEQIFEAVWNMDSDSCHMLLCRFGQRQEYTRLSPFYGSMPHTALWEAASSSRRSAAFLLP